MDFKKDILLIDTEFSGFDVKNHDLLQIAAVLLDRKTLKEKKSFNSYIKPVHWKSRDKASMAVNKITPEKLKNAPSLKSVLTKFNKTFGHNVIQAFYVGYNDKRFLMHAYSQSGIKWQFDYHYFDLWALCYAYLAKKNLLKSKKDFAGFGLEYLIKILKIDINPNEMHDALVDCRLEAEVFRKIIRAD